MLSQISQNFTSEIYPDGANELNADLMFLPILRSIC
jgi:hypothetical protein